jgi:nickel transport system substrate-binding protein
VAVRAGAVAATGLSPLSYRGGFETKTALYETLVRRDDRGRIVPGLAESWEARDGGRTWSFRIRKGARFHDGKPVDAESVRVHFHRWVGLPEHAWIGASERIREVAAVAPDVIEVRLDRPYYLLADLLAVNPGAVRGPGALDREGTFLAPVGTGPFRWIDAAADGGRLCLARFDPTRPWRLDLVRFEPTAGPEPLLEALRAGELDVVCDTWHERIPRDAFAALAADPKYRTMTGPGSSVWHLRLRGRDGPTADVAVRRAIAAAIDRAELIRAVESGHADPCTGLFAPSIADWPPGAAPAPASAAPPAGTTLRVRLGGTRGAPAGLEETLVAQLRKAGFAVEPLAAPAEPAAGGDRRRARDQADVWLARSYGVPYDPDLQLRAMFRPPTGNPSALGERPESLDPGLSALVGELQEEVREEARRDLYRKIQARADEQALVIPLYAPRRLAVLRAEVDGLRLDHDIYAIDLTGLRRRAEGRSE